MLFERILAWFDVHQRSYPWRYPHPDPYHVWISEIMLQQTRTTTVMPYYLRFLERFPTQESLANASLDEVLHLWQGLGYYRRAVSMHAMAQKLGTNSIPQDKESLLALPGIGLYTAHAILAIAFGQPYLPEDGNVRRIFRRYYGQQVPEHVDFLGRPGDIAQGLMDFANQVCLPKKPKCQECPLRDQCHAYRTQDFSATCTRPAKKIQYTIAHVCQRDNCVALRRQGNKGLLAHLWNVPLSEFSDEPVLAPHCLAEIRHVFTHIDLQVSVVRDVNEYENVVWVPVEELDKYPLSRLAKKVLAIGLYPI